MNAVSVLCSGIDKFICERTLFPFQMSGLIHAGYSLGVCMQKFLLLAKTYLAIIAKIHSLQYSQNFLETFGQCRIIIDISCVLATFCTYFLFAPSSGP